MTVIAGDHGIPVRNAWTMLLYAWDLASFGERWRASAEDAPSLLGLLASVLADATDQLLSRRLALRHQPHRETVRGVRGRIDFERTLAGLHLHAGRATCRFSALDIDTLPNRILKATLDRLSRDSRLAPGNPLRAEQLRQRLLAQLRAMEGVKSVRLASVDFARLQLGRSDHAYVLPLSICRLVLDLRLPTEDAGDHAIRALVRDEVNFRHLFERFVRSFWRIHLTGFRVQAERLQWHDELGSPFVPTMTTDITLTEVAAPHRRLVVDTKFAEHTLVRSPHGPLRFRTGNLYQLYAYLRTQEDRGPSFASAGGMLLYPTTDGNLDEAMRVQGHTIRVATVDLAAPWEQVEERLMGLARTSFPSLQDERNPTSVGV